MDIERPSGLLGVFVDALPKGIHNMSPIGAYQEAYEVSGFKYPLERVINLF